jgi:hypothetical protein
MIPPLRFRFLLLSAQFANICKMGAFQTAIESLLLCLALKQIPAVLPLADAEFCFIQKVNRDGGFNRLFAVIPSHREIRRLICCGETQRAGGAEPGVRFASQRAPELFAPLPYEMW